MFTGIIEEVGRIQRLGGGSLTIAAKEVLQDVHVGDSIAVNGICLTVTSFAARHFTADVMPETVRRTSLAGLRQGSPVNLERALQLGGRLGGHIVSGHIDGTGTICAFRDEKNAILMTVKAEPAILQGIVEKGSVALDGISLTVAEVTDQDFTVSLIPHTREVTNLGSRKAGDCINIENDVIGKYVAKLLSGACGTAGGAEPSGQPEGLTKDFLIKNGFFI
ncbi:MAG: riboflavin synthase [Selenomonadaceae bacterium]|nr:riboflavin synthase [Selenomonadaceae bacterium]